MTGAIGGVTACGEGAPGRDGMLDDHAAWAVVAAARSFLLSAHGRQFSLTMAS